MPQYEIKQWQAVIPKENQEPYPMIYIKGDDDFEKYAKENNYMVLATIKNTSTPYDDKPIIAVVESSGYFPQYRPNFYNKTNYYVLILLTEWKGYPSMEGIVEVRGNAGPDKLPIAKPRPFEPPVPLELYTKKENYIEKYIDKSCGFSTQSLMLIILALFLVFFGMFLFSLNFNKISR